MAQPSPSVQPNGVPSPAPVAEAVGTPETAHPAVPVKRKRDEDGETPVEDTEMKMDVDDDKPSLADLKDSPTLVRDYVTVITRYAILRPRQSSSALQCASTQWVAALSCLPLADAYPSVMIPLPRFSNDPSPKSSLAMSLTQSDTSPPMAPALRR